MPQDDNIRKRVSGIYNTLKSHYGDKLSVDENEFFNSITSDSAKAVEVYKTLENLYGDKMVDQDTFLNSILIKKKDQGFSVSSAGVPNLGVPKPEMVQPASTTKVATPPLSIDNIQVDPSNEKSKKEIENIVRKERENADSSFHLPGSDYVSFGEAFNLMKDKPQNPDIVKKLDKPVTLNDILFFHNAYPSDVDISKVKYDLIKDKPLTRDDYDRIMTRLQHNPDYLDRTKMKKFIEKPQGSYLVGTIKEITKATIPWIRDLADILRLPENVAKRAMIEHAEKKTGEKLTPQEEKVVSSSISLSSAFPSVADGLSSAADYYEKRLNNPNDGINDYEMPDNFMGKVLTNVAGFMPFVAAMSFGAPEVNIAGKTVPSLFTLMATKGTLPVISRGIERGDKTVKILKDAGLSGAEALGSAALLSLFGLTSSKVGSVLAKKTGSSFLSALGMHGTMGTAFAAQDAVSQLLNTGHIDPEQSAAVGVAMTPFAVKDVISSAIGKGLYNFITYDKLWLDSPRSPNDMRILAEEMVNEADKAKEDGDGKKYLGYTIAAANLDGLADALAVKEAFLKNPGQFSRIVKSFGLDPKIEEAVLQRGKEVMSEYDPKMRLASDLDDQAQSLREEIDLVNGNDKLSPVVKKTKVKILQDQLTEIEGNIEKILAGSKEPLPKPGEKTKQEKPGEIKQPEKAPLGPSEKRSETISQEKGNNTTKGKERSGGLKIKLDTKSLTKIASGKGKPEDFGKARRALVDAGVNSETVDKATDNQVARMALDHRQEFTVNGDEMSVEYGGTKEHPGVKVTIPKSKSSPVRSENGVEVPLSQAKGKRLRIGSDWKDMPVKKDGKKIGDVMVQILPGMMRVRNIEIDKEHQGAGLGKDVYVALREEALRRGMELHSDEFLNDKSAPIWESFVARKWAEHSGNGYVFNGNLSKLAGNTYRISGDVRPAQKYNKTGVPVEYATTLREMYLRSNGNRGEFFNLLKKNKKLFNKISNLPDFASKPEKTKMISIFNAAMAANDLGGRIDKVYNGTEGFKNVIDEYKSGLMDMGLSRKEQKDFMNNVDFASELADQLDIKPKGEAKLKPTESKTYSPQDLTELKDKARELANSLGWSEEKGIGLVNNIINSWHEAVGGDVDSSFLYKGDTLNTLYSIISRAGMMKESTRLDMIKVAQNHLADVAGDVVSHLISAADKAGVMPDSFKFFLDGYGFDGKSLVDRDAFNNDFIRYLRIGEEPTPLLGRIFDFIRRIFGMAPKYADIPKELRGYFDVMANGENLAEYEIRTKMANHPPGEDITKSVPIYKDRGSGNVWVRQSDQKDNRGRTLLMQFSNHIFDQFSDKELSNYFDKLYSSRKGYYRSSDFWEVPWWVAKATAASNKADFYVIRDVDEAVKFLKDSGYKDIAFSVLDVNAKMIKDMAGKLPDVTFHVGGYVDMKMFDGLKNVKTYNNIWNFYKFLGSQHTGYDYRFFKGMPIIPRLQMSVGCRYHCAFCDPSIPRKVTPISDNEIWKQVDAMKDLHVELVYLDDKTFGQSPNYRMLKKIYERLSLTHPEFRGFIIQTTSEQFAKMDTKFLHNAGIRYAEVGLESYNNSVLKKMNKPETTEIVDKAVDKARKSGVDLIANVLYGFPGEDRSTYENTVNFLIKNSDIISHINIYSATPYNGTKFADMVGPVSENDLNENVRIKSWMNDPEAVNWFIDQVSNITDKLLNRPSNTDIDILVGRIGGERNLSPIKKGLLTGGLRKVVDSQGIDGSVVDDVEGEKGLAKIVTSLAAQWSDNITDAIRSVNGAVSGISVSKADVRKHLKERLDRVNENIFTIIAKTEKDGGVTFDQDGNVVNHGTGYQVGGFVPTEVYDRLTPEILREYVRWVAKEFSELGDGFEIGTWKYEGKYYLDVSKHMKSKVEALKFMKENAEKEAHAWKLNRGVDKPTLINKIKNFRKQKELPLTAKSGEKVISAPPEEIPPENKPPSKEPPSVPPEGKPGEGGTKQHRLGVRVIESSELPDNIKAGVRAEGIDYVPVKMNLAQEEAENIVRLYSTEDGGFERIERMISGTSAEGVTDLTRVMLARALAKEYISRSSYAANTTEARKWEKAASDVFINTMKYLTQLGQAIKGSEGFKDLLGDTPEILKNAYRKKVSDESQELFLGKEKELEDLIKAINDIKKDGLFNVILKNQVRDILRRQSNKSAAEKKAIDDFFDKLIIDRKKTSHYSGIPVDIYNDAIEKMRWAAYGAKKIKGIVEAGSDYLKSKGVPQSTVDWFAQRMTEKLSSGEINLIDVDKAAGDLVKKFAKSFNNLTGKKLRDAIRSSLLDLQETGALSNEDVKNHIRRALGYRAVEEDVLGKLEDAANKLREYNKAGTQLEEKMNEYDEAQEVGNEEDLNKLGKELDLLVKKLRGLEPLKEEALRSVNDLFSDYPDLISMWMTLVKGGLLTPSSLMVNLVSNMSMPLLRAPMRMVASVADKMVSGVAFPLKKLKIKIDPIKHPRLFKYLHDFPDTKAEYYNGPYMREMIWGTKYGLNAAFRDMVHGPSQGTLASVDVYHGIHPFKASKDLVKGIIGAAPLKAKNIPTKILEALPSGYLAEFMFRALSAGDRIFKIPYYRGRLAEIGTKRGYKGARLRAFIEKPDPQSSNDAMAFAEKMLWQRSSKMSSAIARFVSKPPRQDMGAASKAVHNIGRIIVGLVAPFVKTPLGIAGESLSYIIPPVSLAEAWFAAKDGRRHDAEEAMAKAFIGTIAGAVALQLIKNNILTPGLSQDKRQRTQQYEYEPPYSVNIDALHRFILGKDPHPQNGDRYKNIQRFGVISAIMMSYAEAYSDVSRKDINISDVWTKPWYMLIGSSGRNFPAVKTALDQTFMVGMNTILQALLNPALGGETNMDRAVLALSRSATSAIVPNTIAQVSKSFPDELYIKDTKDFSDKDKAVMRHLENDFKDRVFGGSDLPSLVTPWGEKVRRVDYNQNWANYLFGIAKERTYDANSIGGKIYEAYRDNKDQYPDQAKLLLPMPPSPKDEVGWLHYSGKDKRWHGETMSPEVYEEYAIRLGKTRANYAQSYVESKDWEKDPFETKVEKLRKLYSDARKQVLADMFYWDDYSKDHKKEWGDMVNRIGYVPFPRNDKKFMGINLNGDDVREINLRAIDKYMEMVQSLSPDFVGETPHDILLSTCNAFWNTAYTWAATIYTASKE